MSSPSGAVGRPARSAVHARAHLPKPRYRGTSHFYALFVAATAALLLVATAPAGLATVGAVVYATTLVGMFGASTLYHRGNWSASQAKRLLRLDHTAIFLLIAGTYTPIALLVMEGRSRILTLGAVWLIAIGGIGFEWMPIAAPRGYVTTVYLGLGWIGILSFVPLYDATGWVGVILVAGGGLCYTTGAIVHAARRPDPWPDVFGYHEVFHGLVILAAALHYVAIAFLVLPLA